MPWKFDDTSTNADSHSYRANCKVLSEYYISCFWPSDPRSRRMPIKMIWGLIQANLGKVVHLAQYVLQLPTKRLKCQYPKDYRYVIATANITLLGHPQLWKCWEYYQISMYDHAKLWFTQIVWASFNWKLECWWIIVNFSTFVQNGCATTLEPYGKIGIGPPKTKV